MIPLVLPNWASGNQNQLIPNVAFLVATSGSNKAMAGVPSSLTDTDEFLPAAPAISLKMFIQNVDLSIA